MFTELEDLGGKKAGREGGRKELDLAERVREAGGRRGVRCAREAQLKGYWSKLEFGFLRQTLPNRY